MKTVCKLLNVEPDWIPVDYENEEGGIFLDPSGAEHSEDHRAVMSFSNIDNIKGTATLLRDLEMSFIKSGAPFSVADIDNLKLGDIIKAIATTPLSIELKSHKE